MPLPVTIPNTFANATTSIPLSQLDSNFSTLANAINGINSGSETVANLRSSNVTITGGIISNVTLDNVTVDVETLSNVTINGGNVTVTNMVATTANANTINVTTINARDGTASMSLANTTGILSLSNALVTTAGTSAAPAIYPTGDPNTGIFFPAADTIAFTEGGAEAMRITSSGTVGIGTTTTPTAKLWVESGRVGLSNTYKLGWHSNPAHGDLANYITGDDNSNYIAIGTSATERMRIDSSGNIRAEKAVRATITADNDGSFDMNAASNFTCTPTGAITLTFTNITSGQSGNILLVNNSNYAITAAATTKVATGALTTLSATGTYWLSYFSNGTNVYIANTGALA